MIEEQLSRIGVGLDKLGNEEGNKYLAQAGRFTETMEKTGVRGEKDELGQWRPLVNKIYG